ncbi:hypothetical protein H8B09_07550 [Paenibacillus sp. PR3]|uniref:DUF5643 domain-containing protein n=1 Tax=Paenibacillus terricola TaxID=2763503 RepID=A0ABR8MUM5_9BACL|nr:hypothetical protein [Paenibacillus terricola]MBD3918600.1 hypothetical protein [Paenibacillus terricola]
MPTVNLLRFTRNKLIISFVLLIVVVGIYFILNRTIVIDRTDQVLGDYDFPTVTTPDIELLAEGTGKQIINAEKVSTKIRILSIMYNDTSEDIVVGSEIEARESFVAFKYRQVSKRHSWPFIPGKALYGTGTSYKHIKKGEQRKLFLRFNKERNEYWIMPDEMVKQ